MRIQHQSLRRFATTVALAATIGLFLPVGIAWASPTAHAAKTINVTEYASLHLIKKDGSHLQVAGTAAGTLPGRVTAAFDLILTKVTGSVTFHPRGGGTLTVRVVGFARSARTIAPFDGTLTVVKGTGRFKGAVGSGTFEGVVNRRTWDVTVTARARLTY